MMKMRSMIVGVCVAACCSLGAAAFAQAPAQRTGAVDPTKSSDTSSGIGKLDDKTAGANIRASTLIGTNIQNEEGKSVGEINDLVIDAESGRVRYAAVTYGGFLGMGNKLFAVPFEAFQVKNNARSSTDSGSWVVVLNVTQQQLEGAQGFDKDHWPDMADATMINDLYRRYAVPENRRREMPRNRDIDINLDINRR